MMRTWIEPSPVNVSPELATAVGGHPLVAEALARRGITDPDGARRFLNPDFYMPASPYELPDMHQAVERIEAAIANRELMCVWGDFDVDGQSSTALLVSALQGLGADVVYAIPDRRTEGHGLHMARLQAMIDAGVRLIVTCDTGVAAHEAIDYAGTRGVDVIVTDHHRLPPALPDAYAVVNPQRLPPEHPLRTLPGVGCAYKLVEALYDSAGRYHETYQFLDLVALGIVADVAEQVADTRFLLQRGLWVMRKTGRLGLQVMMELADLIPTRVDEGHIGFTLAPRLNALGRLDDANLAVELLTTNDLERARILANRLEGLNAERKMLSDQVFQAALRQVERDPSLLDFSVLVLGHEHWPGGIIGIVASRLADRFNRPVILFSTPPGELARGSARSANGVDITAAVASHSDILHQFGGHAMAAGLSLPADQIPPFRRALSRTVRDMLGTADTTPTLSLDGYISLADLSLDLVVELERLAPFGPGNPSLVLAARKLALRSYRSLGRAGDHLRLAVEDETGSVQEVIWWQADESMLPQGRFDLAFTLSAHDYKGRRELQVEWFDARPVDEEPLEFRQRAAVDVVDWREKSGQLEALRKLGADGVMVWSEGDPALNVAGRIRTGLQPAPVLAIWTAPPGPAELKAALRAVNPRKVALFGINPGTDAVQAFVQRFGGLVKHALKARDGEVSLSELAGATGQRIGTVRAGLEWMAARGHIAIIYEEDDRVLLSPDGTTSNERFAPTTTRLAELLHETAAYRAYFRRAAAETLVQA